jgi:hypothetical protein
MYINKRILKKDELEALPHYTLLMLCDDLSEIKDELEETLSFLRLDSTDIEERINDIMFLEEQLKYLKINFARAQECIARTNSKSFMVYKLGDQKISFSLN